MGTDLHLYSDFFSFYQNDIDKIDRPYWKVTSIKSFISDQIKFVIIKNRTSKYIILT